MNDILCNVYRDIITTDTNDRMRERERERLQN